MILSQIHFIFQQHFIHFNFILSSQTFKFTQIYYLISITYNQMLNNQYNLLKYSNQVIQLQGLEKLPQNPSFIFKKKSYLPPQDSKLNIEQLLNNMFPPHIFQRQKKFYKRNVFPIEASRNELEQLQKVLEERLRQRQARKDGICPIRQDIHNQLFDQVIRQCTINCPQRGLLLLRVRDNLKMTFAAYQTLYQGSVVFGNRKSFSAEIGLGELEQKIENLKKKKIILENKRIVLQNQLQATEKSFRQVRVIEEKKRTDELTYLKNQSKHLQDFLHNL